MSTIADKIRELRMIEREQREFLTIPDGVPFKDYINFMEWKPPSQKLYLDFVNQRYGMDGEKCTLQDVFDAGLLDFTRLSKAWLWDGSKGMVEFDVNAPRITYEGLRLEPESTNFLVDSFISSGRAGMQAAGGDWFFGVDKLGTHIHFKQTLKVNYAYKNYQDLDAPEGSHSLTYVSDTTGLSWGKEGFSLQAVGVSGALLEVSYGVYSGKADMQSTELSGRSRGFVKRPYHDTKEPKFYLYQLENYPVYTSPIKTDDVPVTRLPETLTVISGANFTIEADEGIQVNGNEISGFGYIRKLEVK